MDRRPSLCRAALALVVLLGTTAVSGQDEVPFITTPDQVTLAMLELAGVTAADRLVDLGSGDGRIVITAARRFGARGLGVEIVPALVQESRASARAAGVQARVEFREQDLFATDLAGATVVTMYLLPAVNLQLRPRLLALPPGTRIVSHDWDLGDWKPDRSVTIEVPEKAVGREKRSNVHLWRVPALVHGLWCAPAAGLEVTQRFQHFSASLSVPGSAAPLAVVDGRIDGRRLEAAGTQAVSFELDGDRLRLVPGAGGAVSPWPAAAAFTRAVDGRCPA